MSTIVSESARLLARQKKFDEAKESTGIPERELRVLFDLLEKPGSSAVEIAERTGFVVPTLARYLTTLRRGGHVKRELEEDDIRKVRFSLSDTGEKLIGGLLQILTEDGDG